MKSVDLHVHSTYSDGTLTPEELVVRAQQAGLSAIALTDHDTVSGVAEAVEAGSSHGLEIVPGVELSTLYGKKEIHIIGLYIDYTDDALKKELSGLRESRERRNQTVCEKFQQIGLDISYEEMLENYPDAVITRAHFADRLVQRGMVKSRQEAFSRYLGDGCICYVQREKILPEKAIELIRSSGGIAILAHPVLYHMSSANLRQLAEYLCRCGLSGLEAIYSTYTAGDEIQMRKLARENNLLISGGSDYHGANKPHIELGIGRGSLFVPYEVLSNIKKAAGRA